MTERPNLLIIQTDQQSSWSLSIYDDNLIKTPNIDSIGREGAVLNNFFTNSAVCTPSRGCFITGRYPHCHGAYVNNVELNRDEITLARVLADNGYQTGYAGKWHLDGPDIPGWLTPERSTGFEDCRYMYNRGHWKEIIEKKEEKVEVSMDIGNSETYSTDWLTDKILDFLENHLQDQPFFFMVSYPDPHTPFTVREPYSSMFDPDKMPIPDTYYDENRPEWSKARDIRDEGEEKLKENLASYLGEVKCIDDNVGRIINYLESHDLLDNTIIVFTTDHGEYMGEHGILTKNELYETAYHIPFLIRWPEKIQKGTRVDKYIAMVDFQPTILSLMGVTPSGREQGRDASSFLTQTTETFHAGEDAEKDMSKQNINKRAKNWENEVYIHHNTLERVGIFTPEYELAFVKDGICILFDQINDPQQVDNLFYKSEYREVVKRLYNKILKHNRKYDSPVLEWLEEIEL